MGEYARVIGSPGGEVKIGTCENMYYLRWDQRHRVDYDYGIKAGTCEFRFRFPWPDEDDIEPGDFDDAFKRLAVNIAPPEEFEHGIVQFIAGCNQGYNVCLPCPEGPSDHGLTVHRNGFAGSSFLVQQRLIDHKLCAIFECVCGHKWNAPTIVEAAPACEALIQRAESYEIDRETGKLTTYGERLVEIARRVRQGYEAKVPA